MCGGWSWGRGAEKLERVQLMCSSLLDVLDDTEE